jgi:hypothetical protein
LKLGSWEDGKRGEKRSFENRKLGRWEKKREVTSDKCQNTDYTDNKETRGNGDTVIRKKGDTQDERVA